MNSKTNVQKSMGDGLKWMGAIILLLGGVIATYYWPEIPKALRLAGWTVVIFLAAVVLLQTQKGRLLVNLAKESRVELRKVVWPTKQETIRFTIGVIIMVIVMAFALWLIDASLMWVVKWFTG